MLIKNLILVLSGLIALIAQSVYFLTDDRTDNTAKVDKKLKFGWHIAGGAVHCWMYYTVYCIAGLYWGLLMASLTWLFFDGAINTYSIKKEFFYVGRTALLDKLQQWLAAQVQTVKFLKKVDARALSAFLKISFVIISLTLLILHNG